MARKMKMNVALELDKFLTEKLKVENLLGSDIIFDSGNAFKYEFELNGVNFILV